MLNSHCLTPEIAIKPLSYIFSIPSLFIRSAPKERLYARRYFNTIPNSFFTPETVSEIPRILWNLVMRNSAHYLVFCHVPSSPILIMHLVRLSLDSSDISLKITKCQCIMYIFSFQLIKHYVYTS